MVRDAMRNFVSNATNAQGFPHVILAHQGGWDEILWVLVPIAIMVWLLGVAQRRIRLGNSVSDPNGTAPSEPRDISPKG